MAVLIWMISFLFSGVYTSSPILLLNPSFEDAPQHSKPARGWYFCGEPGETPPDVHPTGYFEVDHPPAHGDTYVGMVVRDNGTYEALGQRLTDPLEASLCYTFSLEAARSAQYHSPSRLTGEMVHYNQPVILRLWGGMGNCDHAELLAETEPINHLEWKTYEFQIQPSRSCRYFIIEAYYPHDAGEAYRGNVLIDNCSPFIPVDCSGGTPLTNPQVIAFPAPASREELTALIGRFSKEINFSLGTAELNNQYYYDPSRKPIQENAALQQIVEAVRHIENVDLHVVVKGAKGYLLEERILMLEHKLRALGLYDNQFKVYAFRKRDRRNDWHGINEEENLYFILK